MKSLQKMIDDCVAANNAAHRATTALNEWCIDKYGFEPGDRDIDAIIDAVLGGSGVSNGMKADEFRRLMEEATSPA